jgi:hypothetical protein
LNEGPSVAAERGRLGAPQDCAGAACPKARAPASTAGTATTGTTKTALKVSQRLLLDFDAFFLEHRRCGDLDGVDWPVVWIACECGARMARRADETTHL